MGHGRTVCICGNVLMSCRCPGPHEDTVSAAPCRCKQESAIQPIRNLLGEAKEMLRESLIEDVKRLTQELSDARAALGKAGEVLDGWILAPWTGPTGKDGEPPCLSPEFWRYMMNRSRDVRAALRQDGGEKK